MSNMNHKNSKERCGRGNRNSYMKVFCNEENMGNIYATTLRQSRQYQIFNNPFSLLVFIWLNKRHSHKQKWNKQQIILTYITIFHQNIFIKFKFGLDENASAIFSLSFSFHTYAFISMGLVLDALTLKFWSF